jgi:hypothetical protein
VSVWPITKGLGNGGTLWTVEVSREDGLERNSEKSKYTVISRHQNAGQNRNSLIANESFGNVTNFKYLETTATNQNCIHKEIKSS